MEFFSDRRFLFSMVWCCVAVFVVPQHFKRSCEGTTVTLNMRNLSSRHSVSSQKNLIFCKSTMRTSNLACAWCFKINCSLVCLWLVKLWCSYSILCRCWRLTWASGIRRSVIWWSWARRWHMRATLTQTTSWVPVTTVRRSECVMLQGMEGIVWRDDVAGGSNRESEVDIEKWS